MARSTDGDGGLAARRREFSSYSTAKADEIEEQRQAWRYYHSLQHTKRQVETLEKRGQPLITFDRLSRKIDGMIGTVRRLRTDPKAFPRTPNQEEGAEIATQVIRTICDQSDFEDIEAECSRDAAVHGIGVAELLLTKGDHDDPDVQDEYVDPRTFFYDPRSVKPDFDDARYMGVYKWVGIDELDEIKPGASETVNQDGDGTFSTAFDSDRESLWVDEKNRVRLVDHWYIEGGIWKWCLHVGTAIIDEGESPHFDRLGRSRSKFHAFANQIDQDGIHYGYIRRLKGPQDAMNQHRSKALHIMNTRQVYFTAGAVKDIEATRREVARPDGVIEILSNDPNALRVEDGSQEFLKQTQYYEDAKQEIETFGPNPALLGDMGQSASGRAYAMAQQAGLAELGPFLKNFRMWKLNQYQAMWCAATRYWTSERMIRVTDDEKVAQFLELNKMQFDEWGNPQLQNALGSIDVDIIISEGPDTESVMGDVYDVLTSLSNSKIPIPPQVIIEASNLPGSEKKKLIKLLSQPDPAKEQAQQLELQGKAAENAEIQSRAMLNASKARSEGMPQPGAPQQPAEFELPPELQIGQAYADIQETQASALQKRMAAMKLQTEAQLAPQEVALEAIQRNADRTSRQQQFERSGAQ